MKVLNSIKTILTLVLALSSTLYAGSSILLVESAPYNVSIGKCYDILDTKVPLGRTYSGILGIKNKSDFVFYHSTLMSDISLENAVFGLKRDFLKWIKLGGYGTYLNMGPMNERSSSGISTGTLTAYDFYFGVPVVFNTEAVKMGAFRKAGTNVTEASDSGTVAKRDVPPIETILSSMNAAVNINYFQSSLEGDTMRSIFADINLSTRLKAPYIGQPASLLSVEDVKAEEEKKIEKYTQEYEAKLAEYRENPEMEAQELVQKEQELMMNKNAYVAKTKRFYRSKVKDIKHVHNVRDDIYNVVANPEVEISGGYVSNLISKSEMELTELKKIASNAIHVNTENILTTLYSDLDENRQSIGELKNQVDTEIANPNLQKQIKELFNLYETRISEKFSDESKRKRRGYDVYTVKEGDTIRSIAAEQYGDSNRFTEIMVENNIEDASGLNAGSLINISRPEYIEEMEAAEIEFETKADEMIAAITTTESLSLKEQTILNSVQTVYSARMNLLSSIEKQQNSRDRKFDSLNNNFLAQIGEIHRARESMLRSLKRVKLKKDLAFLNATRESKYAEALRDYKRDEKIIFENLLRQIYKAKSKLIRELKDEEKMNKEAQIAAVNTIYSRKLAAVEKEYALKLADAADEAEKIVIQSNKEAAISEVKELEQKKIEESEQNYEMKIEEYDWELYLTQLIYLSSEEKKRSFAVGTYFKNLGIPTGVGDEKDVLPVALGFDLNYAFLDIENHMLINYIHYGYTTLNKTHTFSTGLMYRVFDMVEVRGGFVYENEQVWFGTGAAVMLDIGLMNTRFDLGFKFDKNFGNNFNLGVNVLF